MMVRAFIQARMSSTRFPGKVLAPLCGHPVLWHVIAAAAEMIPKEGVVVLTSTGASDDPVACYARHLGVEVFRGSLENVFERFQRCLQAHPCDWFFRICADSPLLDSELGKRMLAYGDRPEVDLVTTIFPRTVPHGQNLELIRASRFAGLDASALTAEESEHVTQVYYHRPDAFGIISIAASGSTVGEIDVALDRPEDLERLEAYAQRRRTVPPPVYPPKADQPVRRTVIGPTGQRQVGG